MYLLTGDMGDEILDPNLLWGSTYVRESSMPLMGRVEVGKDCESKRNCSELSLAEDCSHLSPGYPRHQ